MKKNAVLISSYCQKYTLVNKSKSYNDSMIVFQNNNHKLFFFFSSFRELHRFARCNSLVFFRIFVFNPEAAPSSFHTLKEGDSVQYWRQRDSGHGDLAIFGLADGNIKNDTVSNLLTMGSQVNNPVFCIQ